MGYIGVTATTDLERAIVKKLTIEHNHGHLTLTDVTFETYTHDTTAHGGSKYIGRTAIGTVESGGETSRLFWATSTTKYPVGKIMRYEIYGREPYCVNREKDEWRVSCVSC